VGIDKFETSVDAAKCFFHAIEAGRCRLLVGGRTDHQPPTARRTPVHTLAVTEFLARSTTLTRVGWIGYIIIGAIAGWVAKRIMHIKEGFIVTTLIGIAGALIGGFLLSFFFNTAEGGWWFTLLTAILGSVILLWLFKLVRRA
jgi:uncharacterized membrane protein YeaQ/YmgE (transglycosylase-associated protein family)